MYNIHASMALHPGLAGDQFIAVSNSFLGSLFVFVLFPSILKYPKMGNVGLDMYDLYSYSNMCDIIFHPLYCFFHLCWFEA